MSKDIGILLKKDKEISELDCNIQDVSSYIKCVSNIINKRKKENVLFLYRGESQIYDTSCRANIFRKNLLDSNEYFEKNLFDAMRQNYLSNDKHYLDNAIDAQHGEFPSRLLDVSYNCLLALYFAVTPYYHKKEDGLDGEDGMVFIFYINEIFSPSAKNTNDNYNAIINKEKNWFNDQIIFQKNHKFIDHTKLNSRIIAQQGAFILFQGNDASDLPAYLTHGLKIPQNSKKKIREELNILFGIHTGTVYPEIMNLVEDISQKSKRINTKDFNCYNELNYAVLHLEKELDYYLEYLVYYHENKINDIEDSVFYVEKVINSYRIGLIKFVMYEVDNAYKNIDKDELVKVIVQYNKVISNFIEGLKTFEMNGFSDENLLITYERELDK